MTKVSLRGVAVAALASAALIGAAPALAQSMAHGAHAEATVTVGGAAMYPTKTIVENAVNSPIHTTLVAAVKAAGLVETLSGPGPFTVFAPTDDAFAKLPAGTVETLVEPANKATLTRILTYHVVAGEVFAKDLAGKTTDAKTVNGATVKADGTNGVKINDATVIAADVDASNGLIHVIDTVLLPPATTN